jgi:hypothetical protein
MIQQELEVKQIPSAHVSILQDGKRVYTEGMNEAASSLVSPFATQIGSFQASLILLTYTRCLKYVTTVIIYALI